MDLNTDMGHVHNRHVVHNVQMGTAGESRMYVSKNKIYVHMYINIIVMIIIIIILHTVHKTQTGDEGGRPIGPQLTIYLYGSYQQLCRATIQKDIGAKSWKSAQSDW